VAEAMLARSGAGFPGCREIFPEVARLPDNLLIARDFPAKGGELAGADQGSIRECIASDSGETLGEPAIL
jgi:hypothetical protein